MLYLVDPEEYRKKLESDILNIIEEKLKKGEMDADRARAIARMVLNALHPPLTFEQIYKIAPTLDDHFTELTTVVLPIVEAREEEIKNAVTNHAQKLINEGRIEEATKVLKDATNN